MLSLCFGLVTSQPTGGELTAAFVGHLSGNIMESGQILWQNSNVCYCEKCLSLDAFLFV